MMPPDTLSTEKSESSSSLQLLNRSLHNSLPNITTDSNNNNNISIFKQLGSETNKSRIKETNMMRGIMRGRGKDVSTIKGEYGIREEEEASLPLPSSSNIAQLLLFFAAPIFFSKFSLLLRFSFQISICWFCFPLNFFFVRRLFYFQ